MMTNRCFSIIINLVETNSKYKIVDLAELYGISPRVIYYDVDVIKDYLKSKGGYKLCIEDSYVEIIPEYDCSISKLIAEVHEDSKTNGILTPEERMLEILYKLLKEDTIRISSMVDAFDVSKTTIVKDLDYMKNFFQNEGVKLESSINNGFKLIAEEMRIRIAATNFMMSLLNHNNILNRMNDEWIIWVSRPYRYFFEDYSFGELTKRFKAAIKGNDMPYKIFSICIFGLCIALIRDKAGRKIVFHENDLKMLEDTNTHQLSKTILAALSEMHEIKDKSGMLINIAILLLGARKDYDSILYLNKSIDFKVLASNFASEVCRQMGEVTNGNLIFDIRNILFQMLINADIHKLPNIGSSISLLQNGYKDLLQMVKNSGWVFENTLGKELKEYQYEMLAACFIELYDTHKQRVEKHPNVLIVCNDGTVVSRLISNKLQLFLEINIIGTISVYEVNDFIISKKVDYIITTVPLVIKDVPCIQVSSFLNEYDVSRLWSLFPVKKINKEIIYKIADIAEKNGILVNKLSFMEEVATVLNIDNAIEVQKQKGLNLYDIAVEECILLDAEFDDLNAAVYRSGELLLEKDYIQEEYIREIVSAVKKVGRYMLIGEGIIMPHSLAGKYVNKIGISIIRLKDALHLYDTPQTEIRWIFTLCTTDKERHLTALTQLAKIIGNPVLLKELSLENSVKGLREILFEASNPTK